MKTLFLILIIFSFLVFNCDSISPPTNGHDMSNDMSVDLLVAK